MSKPVVLMILDGWGIGEATAGNAIALAQTPNYDGLWAECPHSQLLCAGEAVGLPSGQQGNSEVGHLNIGSGRVVYQELTRINKALAEGTFADNAAFLAVMAACRRTGKALHLMGLLSPGGVHSHSDHLLALVKLAQAQGLTRVYIHGFLDGRDVGPRTAQGYVQELAQQLQEIGVGEIASIGGRYYAMDRDNRWERVAQAYGAMTGGAANHAHSAVAAIAQSYDAGISDEFVVPTTMVTAEGQPVGNIASGDGLIFFNFRADRAREISHAFVDADFDGFARPTFLALNFVAMTQYEAGLAGTVAFPPQDLINTLGETLSLAGVKQFRVAETEKYAHVTFFFNGGVEAPYVGEERCLVPSPAVATYDLQPEMSAYAVTAQLLQAIEAGQYAFLLVNFANTDMVGHTGNLAAAIKAAEVVDDCLGQVVRAVRAREGTVLITADHGNAEQMIDLPGMTPFTAHTANRVPFVVVTHTPVAVSAGMLADVAPTVLQLLGLVQPVQMSGHSLVTRV